jgi:signal transduction histidine kinase
VRLTRARIVALIGMALALAALTWHYQRNTVVPRSARIGYAHDPPYMFQGENGTPQGLDVDVMQRAATRAGITLEWVYVAPAHHVDAALRDGRVDIWPALTILPARTRDFFFTDPWLQAEVWVVVRGGTGLPPESFDGRIGLAPLPVTSYLVREHFPRARHVPYRDGQALAQALCNGEVNVGLLAAADLSQAVTGPDQRCRAANLRPFVLPDSMLNIAVAARPGYEGTAARLRAQIDAMAADGSIRAVILPYSLYAATEVLAVYDLLQARAQARLYLWVTIILGVALAGSIVLFAGWHRANRRARQSLEERAALEERLHATQRLDLVGRFAGGIAHDFNNLVTVIVGYAGLAANRQPSDPVIAEAITEINHASDRASDLVRQLLAFGRKETVEPRVLSLHEQLEALRPLMRRLVQADVAVSIAPGATHDRVLIDPGQLSRVLLNLASNARDAMPQGGHLRISTVDSRDADGHDRVCLRIEDTGVGMAPEVCRRVFEPFFTTKATGHGTGLGLSVVHGIVGQAGGEIDVESELGVGTCFTVWLPLVHLPRPAANVSRAEQAVAVPAPSLLAVEPTPELLTGSDIPTA